MAAAHKPHTLSRACKPSYHHKYMHQRPALWPHKATCCPSPHQQPKPSNLHPCCPCTRCTQLVATSYPKPTFHATLHGHVQLFLRYCSRLCPAAQVPYAARAATIMGTKHQPICHSTPAISSSWGQLQWALCSNCPHPRSFVVSPLHMSNEGYSFCSHGCCRASAAVGRLLGSMCSRQETKESRPSSASGRRWRRDERLGTSSSYLWGGRRYERRSARYCITWTGAAVG